ncbi:hypothetical protein H101_08121, partial [Trichophyton interdigitale H6]
REREKRAKRVWRLYQPRIVTVCRQPKTRQNYRAKLQQRNFYIFSTFFDLQNFNFFNIDSIASVARTTAQHLLRRISPRSGCSFYLLLIPYSADHQLTVVSSGLYISDAVDSRGV